MEENKDKSHAKKMISESTRNERMIVPITLRDLILFKEEVLKEMKVYQNKIDQSISKNYEKCEKLLEASNSKLYNFETDKAAFMKQIEFIEEKNKILSIIDEKDSELKSQLNVSDLHINNCQKELDEACFKYDRTIVNNLLIPGIVGNGCKFPYFKEYINDIQNQINLAMSKIQQNMNNLTAHKSTYENQIRQMNTKIKKLELDSKQFTNEKFIALDNKFTQMIDTLNSQLTTVMTEYHKSNIELKDKVSEVKTIGSYIVEENRKINIKTLNEFEKMKKYMQKMKKNVVELSTLLTTGGSYSVTGKFNKNIANNREKIIQQFNNMIIGLMRDVTKDSAEFNNEINNVFFPKKKNVGSLIKQYIKGNIKAEDTKFMEEKNKKLKKYGFNKKNTTINIDFRSSARKKVSSLPKNEDLKLNSEFNNTNNNLKKIGRLSSVEFNSFNKLNTNNNYEVLKKNNNFFSNDGKIHVIKEENIQKSKTLNENDSISVDIDENSFNEENNIFKNLYPKNSFEDKNLIKLENNQKKDKRKLFFRAATSNLDNKFINFGNNLINTNENFKLFQKAQENIKRKNLEKIINFKTNESSIKSIDKNKKENNSNSNIIEKKDNKKEYKYENELDYKIQTNNNFNLENHQNEKTSEFNIKETPSTMKKEDKKEYTNINNNLKEKTSNNTINNNTDAKSKRNSIKKEEEEKEKEKDKEKDNEKGKIATNKNQKNSTTNTINTISNTRINHNNNIKINIISNNTNTYSPSPISPRPKSIISIKNNIQNSTKSESKTFRKNTKNDSPENNVLKNSKNIRINNNIKGLNLNINTKENTLTQSDNYNNLAINTTNKNRYKTQENINNNKNVNLTLSNKKRPLSIMNSCQTRPLSKYKVKNKFNIFNEDIFIDKNLIQQLNYCKDEDIIDKPLLINQTNFKLDNTKGSLENKLLELEYFTKRKLDQLVREIKNFIPIHFNAYIKE